MAISRQKKEEILKNASEVFNDSLTTVFVHFSGLDANTTNEMRSEMNKESVKFTVAKKTLIKMAAQNAKVDGEIPEFGDGEIGFVYSFEDQMAPARLVKEFAKKTDGKIEIIGGIFDGQFKTKEEMQSIADIPSLDTLRGMFVNIINSPIQRTVVALGQIAEKKEA